MSDAGVTIGLLPRYLIACPLVVYRRYGLIADVTVGLSSLRFSNALRFFSNAWWSITAVISYDTIQLPHRRQLRCCRLHHSSSLLRIVIADSSCGLCRYVHCAERILPCPLCSRCGLYLVYCLCGLLSRSSFSTAFVLHCAVGSNFHPHSTPVSSTTPMCRHSVERIA
jgi:hypothetical protein